MEGKEVEQLEVSDSVFGLKENDDLVHQVVLAISNNRRIVHAHTKTRGERAGSGIKPWRQKGTGRARVGSVRTPVWKKGGVAFGPRSDKNYKQKVNKKMNTKAVAIALSGKIGAGELVLVDKLAFSSNKTKLVWQALKNLKISGKTLISFAEGEKNCRLASRNLDKVENILTSQLNVLDMLNNKNLVMSKESVKYLENKYGKK